jgi:hypothetical protein
MDKVVIGLLALSLVYLTMKKPTNVSNFEAAPVAVDRDIIQRIIEAVQEKEPGWVPINTVYINPIVTDQGSTLYDSRFMFYDKFKYLGTQIDVRSAITGNQASIVSMTPVSQPNADPSISPFKGPTYQDYDEIKKNFNRQLDDYLAMAKRPEGFQTPY